MKLTDRWRVTLLVLAFAVVAQSAVMLVIADRSGSGEGSNDAPGYHGEVVDAAGNASFELAGPTGRPGATTLPDALVLPPGRNATTTTSTSSTTTTIPPPYLPSEILSLCGISQMMNTALHGPFDPSQIQDRLNEVVVRLNSFRQVAPPRLKGDITGMIDTLQTMGRLFQEGGGRTDYPPLVTAVTALINGTAPFTEVKGRLDRILTEELSVCGPSGIPPAGVTTGEGPIDPG